MRNGDDTRTSTFTDPRHGWRLEFIGETPLAEDAVSIAYNQMRVRDAAIRAAIAQADQKERDSHWEIAVWYALGFFVGAIRRDVPWYIDLVTAALAGAVFFGVQRWSYCRRRSSRAAEAKGAA